MLGQSLTICPLFPLRLPQALAHKFAQAKETLDEEFLAFSREADLYVTVRVLEEQPVLLRHGRLSFLHLHTPCSPGRMDPAKLIW